MTDRANRPSHAPHRKASAARTGLVIAAIMGAVSIGVVAYFVSAAPRRSRAVEPTISEAPPTSPSAGSISAQPGRAGVGIGSGKGLSVEIASRSDPSRLAGTIKTRTLEPLDANRYNAEKPESFIFLRDGRTIFVRADSAHLYIPRTSDQPESGTLNGHVEISLFDRRSGGVDPARDTPSVKFETDEFIFDLTAWEFSTPGDFRVGGPTMAYLGSRLTLLLNQPQERIELLRVASTMELRLKPGARRESTAPGPTAARPTRESPAAPGTAQPVQGATRSPAQTPPDPPADTFYHGVLTDSVRVARGEASIESDALNLWAHFVDGNLPPDAIAPLRRDDRKPREAIAGSSSSPQPDAQASAPGEKRPTTPELSSAQPRSTPAVPGENAEPDTVITWKGPFELRPLNEKPSELARDDVSFRFSSASATPVRFAERTEHDGGLSGVASSVAYGATSKNLSLQSGVAVAMARSGRLVSDRLDLDLGVGLAVVQSPGSVAGIVGTGLGDPSNAGEDADRQRLVRWSDSAEFHFAAGDDGASGALLSAIMLGGVEATDGASSLRGDAVATNFFEEPGRTGPISRLVVTGDARLEDGRGGGLFCDRLDASFVRRPDSPDLSDPRWVTATGSALASRADEFLSAELIEATLERDSEGRVQVADMIAEGSAVYQGKDGVWAEGPAIRASATRQTAAISGPGSRVGKEGSSVAGTEIELNGGVHTATVFGAGDFSHRGGAGDGRSINADASWTRSMTFDDRSGLLEARGDIRASIRPDEWTTRELEGATALISLTPNPGGPGADLGIERGAPSAAEPRRVVRAEIIGASIDEATGGRATVTSRTYEPADVPEGRRLAEELRVDGDRIVADDVAGTVDVPGAGTLRVVDVRATPSGDRNAAPELDGKGLGARGAARFEWDGSLHLSREEGTVTMRQRVRMRHLPIDRTEMTELESEEIVAHLTDLRDDGTGGGVRGRLVRATAAGAVWARYGTKELTADRLEYLTTERLIRAAANEGNDAVMLDPARPTPIRARVLEWDLARDRIDVKNPGTIVIPK